MKESIVFHHENEHAKNPEQKQYLLLLNFKDEELDKTYELLTGRGAAYIHIRTCLDEIIITKSYVLVEDANLSELITVYEFMKYAERFFPDDKFDIDDYIDEDYDVFETEEENNQAEEYNDPQYVAEKSNFAQQVKQNSINQTSLLFEKNTSE